MRKCCNTCKHCKWDAGLLEFYCDLDDDEVVLSAKCEMYETSIMYQSDLED